MHGLLISCCGLQSDNITTLIKAANVKVEPYWPSLFAKLFETRSIGDLITNVGAGDLVLAQPECCLHGLGCAADTTRAWQAVEQQLQPQQQAVQQQQAGEVLQQQRRRRRRRRRSQKRRRRMRTWASRSLIRASSCPACHCVCGLHELPASRLTRDSGANALWWSSPVSFCGQPPGHQPYLQQQQSPQITALASIASLAVLNMLKPIDLLCAVSPRASCCMQTAT